MLSLSAGRVSAPVSLEGIAGVWSTSSSCSVNGGAVAQLNPLFSARRILIGGYFLVVQIGLSTSVNTRCSGDHAGTDRQDSDPRAPSRGRAPREWRVFLFGSREGVICLRLQVVPTRRCSWTTTVSHSLETRVLFDSGVFTFLPKSCWPRFLCCVPSRRRPGSVTPCGQEHSGGGSGVVSPEIVSM